MLSRTATAVDDEVGDGTSSIILLIGELCHISERYLNESLPYSDIGASTYFLKEYTRVFLLMASSWD